MSLIVRGYSDDNLVLEGGNGDTLSDELGCFDSSCVVVIGHGSHGVDRLGIPTVAKGVRIRSSFGKGGGWSLEVMQLDEDVPMFPVRLTGEGYTVVATVDCPVGVRVRWKRLERGKKVKWIDPRKPVRT